MSCGSHHSTHVIVQNISPSVGYQMSDHFQRGAGHKLNSNSCNERNCSTQQQDEEATHLCSSFEHKLSVRLMSHSMVASDFQYHLIKFCFFPLTSIGYQEILVDGSTPTSVGCSAGVVTTVAPLHRGDGEDVVCHCDSVTTSDR